MSFKTQTKTTDVNNIDPYMMHGINFQDGIVSSSQFNIML